MMNKIYNYASAGARVWYDKVYEYAAYYVGAGDEYTSIDDTDESLSDYSEITDAEQYTKESDSRRIFETSGFFSKYRSFFSDPTHIIDNIYLGSAFNAACYPTIKDLGIGVIINVSHELSKYHSDSDSLIYHQFNVHDDNRQCIRRMLWDIYDVINKYDKDTKILIHCYMGASRSVTVVTHYLMVKHAMSMDAAIKYIRDKRPIINPSHRFAKDLAKSQLIGTESGEIEGEDEESGEESAEDPTL